MQYPQELLSRIEDSIDIVDVIDSYVHLTKKGKNYFACCPFHEEKTPSFSVNPESQLFYCHGCGEGGNAFNFCEKYLNIKFPEAVRALAKIAGIDLPKEELTADQKKQFSESSKLLNILESASCLFESNLKSASKVQDFYKSRGLSPQVVGSFRLGAAKDAWRETIDALGGMQNLRLLVDSGLAIFEAKTETTKGKFYDRYRNAPIFPIRDHKGKVVSFAMRPLDSKDGGKYINGIETDVFNKSNVLYGVYEALQSNPKPSSMMVVEGYIDVISLHQFGMTNAVGTMGTAIAEQKIRSLYRHTNEILFCFDGDRAGLEASKRALNAALPLLDDSKTANFVLMPAGEDPDSLIRKLGPEKFSDYIEKNKIPSSDFIFQIARNGLSQIKSIEERGQFFSNAKVMIDRMNPSATKAGIISRLEQITGIRPREYLPFSIQMAEGSCNGVDLGLLESEIKALIAARIGASNKDVKVQWTMPELGPKIDHTPSFVSTNDSQQEIGKRMREVNRLLSLDCHVSKGLTLARVLASAAGTGDQQELIAQDLLSRYFSDSDAFVTEMRMVVHHMNTIKTHLKILEPTLTSASKEQISNWAKQASGRTFSVSSVNDYLPANSLEVVTSSLDQVNVLAADIVESMSTSFANAPVQGQFREGR
jgi:DNA primase catalytic core